MHVASPIAMAVAAVIAFAAFVVAWLRRVDLPRSSRYLIAVGLLALSLSAGEPEWLMRQRGTVAVMIDLSASTRGAGYRDDTILRHRLNELLAGLPYQLIHFGDDNADRTVFTPPSADAFVLFSDGRFAAPQHSAALYPVIDPNLDSATDAAISEMSLNGDHVSISVVNNGPPRTLTVHGITGPTTLPIDGNQSFVLPIQPGADQVEAELSPGDLWPENDQVSIRTTPAIASEKWWLGASPPENWRVLTDLPTDPADYLAPSVIVLNNISAEQLSDQTQCCLTQYVRDLGGSLLLLGGNHAFAAGNYDGSAIGAISPLVSSPPQPALRWLLLADASGSMNQPESDGKSRFTQASAALVKLLPNLPPADPVWIGQFSDTLRWWSQGRSAKETSALSLPPSDAVAHGPTNLEPVLTALAANPNNSPTQLLLITDAEVVIDDPTALINKLKSADIRVSLLAIGDGHGIVPLAQIVAATGGEIVSQPNAAEWPKSARQLISAALADRVSHEPLDIHFTGSASQISATTTTSWNHIWLDPQATSLATAENALTMAATWHFGTGQVIAAAFAADESHALSLARLIAQPPADSRLKISWVSGPTMRVTIDAIDGQNYLNNLNLSLQIDPSLAPQPMPQSAPGTYQLTLPARRNPAIAIIRHDNQIIARTAIPGWYAPEFSAVGNDHAALESLARQTGGRIITPDDHGPIQFNWPGQEVRLTPWLAMAGAVFIAAGLFCWKRN